MVESCIFTVVARDERAIRHEAHWETQYRPQVGEYLALPAPQGSMLNWEVSKVEHGITGKLYVWIDMQKSDHKFVMDIFEEIQAEAGVEV